MPLRKPQEERVGWATGRLACALKAVLNLAGNFPRDLTLECQYVLRLRSTRAPGVSLIFHLNELCGDSYSVAPYAAL